MNLTLKHADGGETRGAGFGDLRGIVARDPAYGEDGHVYFRCDIAQDIQANGFLPWRIKNRSKDDEIRMCLFCFDGFFQRVRGNTQYGDQRSNTLGRQAITREMNTVGSCGERNVQSIIYEHTARRWCSEIADDAHQGEKLTSR